MYSEHNRAFNYAVLASIVLHGVLLFGVSLRERARAPESPVPLLARLVELPAPVLAPTPAAAPPRAEPVKPRPRAKPLPPKPLARERPAPQPEPAAEPAPEVPPQAEVPAPAEVEAPPAEPPPLVAGVRPNPGEPAEDPGSLEKYRHQLILAAPRYKRYPRIASDNNWSGSVALRMVVGSGGQVSSLTVTKTSGYSVLDQQAVEMFKSAAAEVPVPPVLRGKRFAVEVGASYYFTD